MAADVLRGESSQLPVCSPPYDTVSCSRRRNGDTVSAAARARWVREQASRDLICVPDIEGMVRSQASSVRMAMDVCVRSRRVGSLAKGDRNATDNARILTAGSSGRDDQ